MFNSLQLAICIAIILRPVSFARKISLEDENDVLQEFNEFTPRKISRYNLFQQSKRENLPEVKCKPHPEVVEVEQSVTEDKITPQFVMVNRCKGACELSPNTMNCTAIETRFIAVDVTDGARKTWNVDVEEHLNCACKCHGLKCEEHHKIEEETCQCVCKKKCGNDKNQNPTTCKCTSRAGKQRDEIMEN